MLRHTSVLFLNLYFCIIDISKIIKVLNPSETPFKQGASLSVKSCCSQEKFLPRRRDRRSPENYSTDSRAHAINKYKYYCFMQKPFECFWVLLWPCSAQTADAALNAAVISGDCAPDEDNAPNAGHSRI
jgi:hypothetical protein